MDGHIKKTASMATATAISIGLASPHPTALVAIPTCTTAPTQALVPAAHLPTGAETRLDTAVPAANLFSASALSLTSVLTARAALQTVTRLALGPALATAARREADAATSLIAARPVVSLALGLVMLGQEIFPPTVNAVPMARPALILALETVVRQEDGVAVPVITVVQVVSVVLAHITAGAVPSRMTGSVGQGMVELVRALALETAALGMASVVARRNTAVLVARAASGPVPVAVIRSRRMGSAVPETAKPALDPDLETAVRRLVIAVEQRTTVALAASPALALAQVEAGAFRLMENAAPIERRVWDRRLGTVVQPLGIVAELLITTVKDGKLPNIPGSCSLDMLCARQTMTIARRPSRVPVLPAKYPLLMAAVAQVRAGGHATVATSRINAAALVTSAGQRVRTAALGVREDTVDAAEEVVSLVSL
ncbi:hypothetical protein QC761_0077190 [Podospora bellae-mahoneyi]|uniref:Secreted protein n=1 Tax=Podospora bellae-mahoneyi TaxID=2093777 RepID=A0ABR0FFG3_9PEZI|nr:hypothetical protein QC761_0077190 [Podospora bellae-mahoneyi]